MLFLLFNWLDAIAYGITKKRSFLVMRIVSIPKLWGYDLHKA